jgi:hypothetical protein
MKDLIYGSEYGVIIQNFHFLKKQYPKPVFPIRSLEKGKPFSHIQESPIRALEEAQFLPIMNCSVYLS